VGPVTSVLSSMMSWQQLSMEQNFAAAVSDLAPVTSVPGCRRG